MASRDKPEDLCNTQQASTKSPGPSEGQRDDGSNTLTVQPLPTAPASCSKNNVENQQASTCAKPPPNPSDDQNTSMVPAQSASRLVQEAPLQPPQDASSCAPEGIQFPTPVDTRSRIRQEVTQFPVCDNRPIFNRSSIQPSTSGNVQFRGLEDTQCPHINGRATFDRPLSNPGCSGAEELRTLPQARTIATGSEGRGSTSLDWIVPIEDKCQANRTTTVTERLQPTLSKAHSERNISAMKAKMAGWSLNVAIFLQVLLGSLTTGVAAGATTGKAAVGTTILGALSTIVASFLARARGSGEPELSVTRVKDLEQFIREVDAFLMDHGNSTSNEHDLQLHRFRMRFEELLGNMTHKSARKPPNSETSHA